MLKKEGTINDATIENMLSWHHSGFHVYVGNRIRPDDESGLENLAKYIVRACFSQQRMIYIPVEKSSDGTAKVIYTSKVRKLGTFDKKIYEVDPLVCPKCQGAMRMNFLPTLREVRRLKRNTYSSV